MWANSSECCVYMFVIAQCTVNTGLQITCTDDQPPTVSDNQSFFSLELIGLSVYRCIFNWSVIEWAATAMMLLILNFVSCEVIKQKGVNAPESVRYVYSYWLFFLLDVYNIRKYLKQNCVLFYAILILFV
jgi:hypothetical protein